MWDWFRAGGFLMWPVLAAGLLAVGLAVDAGRKIFGADGDDPPGRPVRRRVGAVLFWGGFAALVGLLGTLGGFVQMGRAFGAGAGASAEVVWGGIRVALIPSSLGLLIFTLTLATWYGLSTAYQKRSGA